MAKQPIELLRRQRVAGTLRMGAKVAMGGKNQDGSNKTRPAALETWRITSDDKALLEKIASMYGGEVKPWEGNPGKFDLITESSEIGVILEPGVTEIERAYEFWQGGGCQRRCQGGDGSDVCEVTDPQTGLKSKKPCFCEQLEDKNQCKPVSRVAMRLAGVPTFGPFNYSSTGIFAAMELPSQIEIMMQNFPNGALCMLAIQPRELKVPGKPTKQFKVAVIRYRVGLAQYILSIGGVLPIDEAKALTATAESFEYSPSLTDGRAVEPEQEAVEEVHEAEFKEQTTDDIKHEAATSVLDTSRGDIEAAFKAHALLASEVIALKAILATSKIHLDWQQFAIDAWKAGVIGSEALTEQATTIVASINSQDGLDL